MRKIEKYELSMGITTIKLPVGSKLLCLTKEGCTVYLYVDINIFVYTPMPMEDIKIALVYTGEEVPDTVLAYIGHVEDPVGHRLLHGYVCDSVFAKNEFYIANTLIVNTRSTFTS